MTTEINNQTIIHIPGYNKRLYSDLDTDFDKENDIINTLYKLRYSEKSTNIITEYNVEIIINKIKYFSNKYNFFIRKINEHNFMLNKITKLEINNIQFIISKLSSKYCITIIPHVIANTTTTIINYFKVDFKNDAKPNFNIELCDTTLYFTTMTKLMLLNDYDDENFNVIELNNNYKLIRNEYDNNISDETFLHYLLKYDNTNINDCIKVLFTSYVLFNKLIENINNTKVVNNLTLIWLNLAYINIKSNYILKKKNDHSLYIMLFDCLMKILDIKFENGLYRLACIKLLDEILSDYYRLNIYVNNNAIYNKTIIIKQMLVNDALIISYPHISKIIAL